MSDIINFENPRFNTPARLRGAAAVKGSTSVELVASIANVLARAKAQTKDAKPSDLDEAVRVRLGSLASYYDGACTAAGVPADDLKDMIAACVMRDLANPALAHAMGEKGKETHESAMHLMHGLQAELATLVRAVHSAGAEERERMLAAQEAKAKAEKEAKAKEKADATKVAMLKTLEGKPGMTPEVLALIKASLGV